MDSVAESVQVKEAAKVAEGDSDITAESVYPELIEQVTEPTISCCPDLVAVKSTAKEADGPRVNAEVFVNPAVTAKEGVSFFAGLFQFIPILLQYIGVEASAHVIGAVNSQHLYSSP